MLELTDTGMPVTKEQMCCPHSPMNTMGRAYHDGLLRKVPVLVRRQSGQGKGRQAFSVPLRGQIGSGVSDFNSCGKLWADRAGHGGPGYDRGSERRGSRQVCKRTGSSQ